MSSETQSRGSGGELGSVGAYTLTAEIARGELSTVFLASRVSSSGPARRAVFRRLRPELRDIPEWRELLADELRIASAVHHPNVVSLLSESPEAPELTPFEYVDGETLEFLLARADVSLKPKLLVPIFADVLRGLSAVHAARTPEGKLLMAVHQAPRAHHVVVGTDGGSRLIDFTQALHVDARASRARADRLQLGYMAPEQAVNPDHVDRRADLFVVGITLWEALTGERLFLADSPQDSYQNMLHRVVPKASGVGRKPPEAFDPLLTRALQRDPEKRFQTAADMQAAVISAGRAIGGPASAFEVGQWVMAIAGPTLRARHGHGTASVAPRATSVAPPAGGLQGAARGDAEKSIPPGTPIKVARPPASVRPASMRPSTGASKPLLQTQRAHDREPIASSPAPAAPAAAAPAASARKSSESPEAPASARPSDTAVLRMVPVSSPPAAFGLKTMVGGYASVPPGASEAPPPAEQATTKGSSPASSQPPGRSRVHTLQAIAAVSLDPSSASREAPLKDDVEVRRTPSDMPTEVLSAEQARELSAALAAAAKPPSSDANSATARPPAEQPSARRQPEHAQGERGRDTKQLFVMPDGGSPLVAPRERSRDAASTPSVPEETVVADMAAFPAELLKASTAPTAPPPAASPSEPDEQSAPSIVPSIEGVLMPASAKPRRAPIHVAEETAELAVPVVARMSGAPSRSTSLAPYTGSRREPSGRYDASLRTLVFVPSVEQIRDGATVWDSQPASARPSAGAVSSRRSHRPRSSRWAWAALVAGVAVVAGLIALGAEPMEPTDDDFEQRPDRAGSAASTPAPPPAPKAVRAAPTAPLPAPAVPRSPEPAAPPESALTPSPAADAGANAALGSGEPAGTTSAGAPASEPTSSRHHHGSRGASSKIGDGGLPAAPSGEPEVAGKLPAAPTAKPPAAPPDENLPYNPY